MDDKSRKCVFPGVSDESKAWRLYDPVSKKIIVSKDVVFEEEESWDWGRTEEEIKRDILEWEDEDESNEEDDQNEEENDGTGSNNLSSSSNSSSISPTESPPNEPNSNTHGELVEGNGVQERRAPGWMADYETGEGLFEEENLNAMMMVTENDPVSFGEAMKNKKWKEAMSVEIKSIERNQTWELTVLPKGVKTIGVKWVFKTKLNEDGDVEKFKARLVAKGYTQPWNRLY